MNAQKRYEKFDNITGRCGIDLQSNHTWMFAKREDYPITKMFIKSNENPIFINRFLQYLLIICSSLADFGGTQNIVAFITQSLGYIQT
jgi:hypothetical protein